MEIQECNNAPRDEQCVPTGHGEGEPPYEFECSDGINNDCDLRLDCEETRCHAGGDSFCNQYCDADADGIRDVPCFGPDCFPGDPTLPVIVNGEPVETRCQDQIDDDCDDQIDCYDADCRANQENGCPLLVPEEGVTCYDSLDNDYDNAIDCADNDCCNSRPDCSQSFPKVCPTPTPTPTPEPGYCGGATAWGVYTSTGCASGFVAIGSTCGRSTYFTDNCANLFGTYDEYSCECSEDACEPPLGGCGMSEYYWSYEVCDCVGWFGPGPSSPVIVDINGDGFAMTDTQNGVMFDITADGVPDQVSWTAQNSDEAFLALDRNGDGSINDVTELFGNHTTQPPVQGSEEKNGFRALAEYDKPRNGGNNDGKITAADNVFTNLRLWNDANHNGVSESSELASLQAASLSTIELDYKESKRTDEFGNQFKFRAKVKGGQNSSIARWAWDVFLVVGNTGQSMANRNTSERSIFTDAVAYEKPEIGFGGLLSSQRTCSAKRAL